MVMPLPAVLGLVFYLSESFLGWRRHSSKGKDSTSADGGTMRVLWLTALLSIGAGWW